MNIGKWMLLRPKEWQTPLMKLNKVKKYNKYIKKDGETQPMHIFPEFDSLYINSYTLMLQLIKNKKSIIVNIFYVML